MITEMWGMLTEAEFLAFDRGAFEILKRVNSDAVHTFYFMHRLENLPKLSLGLNMKASRHPKVGWTFVMGLSNPTLRFMMRAAAGVAGLRLRAYDRAEAAVEYLCQVDPSLEALRTVDFSPYTQA
jgi:hypothetical protein